MFPESKVKEMIAHEVAEAEQKKDSQMKELKEYIAELQEMPSVSDGVIQLEIKGAADELAASVSIKTEEVQQVFSIMQLNAEEGVKAINAVKSEDVLILLHATDSRKTIQNAAKMRHQTRSIMELQRAMRRGRETDGKRSIYLRTRKAERARHGPHAV